MLIHELKRAYLRATNHDSAVEMLCVMIGAHAARQAEKGERSLMFFDDALADERVRDAVQKHLEIEGFKVGFGLKSGVVVSGWEV